MLLFLSCSRVSLFFWFVVLKITRKANKPLHIAPQDIFFSGTINQAFFPQAVLSPPPPSISYEPRFLHHRFPSCFCFCFCA